MCFQMYLVITSSFLFLYVKFSPDLVKKKSHAFLEFRVKNFWQKQKRRVTYPGQDPAASAIQCYSRAIFNLAITLVYTLNADVGEGNGNLRESAYLRECIADLRKRKVIDEM